MPARAGAPAGQRPADNGAAAAAEVPGGHGSQRLTERWRQRIEHRLLELWFPDRLRDARSRRGDRLLGLLLAPLSSLVAAIAARRRSQQRKRMVDGSPKVVVVGNVLVGGTGKTPATIAIALGLAERGWRVAILAGGYRARQTGPKRVDAASDPLEVGDEALLLARSTGLPVASGRDRAAALQLMISAEPTLQVVVSDDGLQHFALPRAVELVVFDRRGIGNGRLLPAGPLREPIAQALAEADALLLNGAATAPFSNRPAFTFEVRDAGVRTLALCESADQTSAESLSLAGFAARVAGANVAAVAGIANPQGFFAMLRDAGLNIVEYALPDHARIDRPLIAAMTEPWIVMTSKDAVKLPADVDSRCWVLDVKARFEPEFFSWLTERIGGHTTA